MWLFTRYGFFSVSVQQGKTFVRARHASHLSNLMKRFEKMFVPFTSVPTAIIATPEADYHFRIIVPRKVWNKIAFELAAEQEWSNFKKEAEEFLKPQELLENDMYLGALHRVWDVMFDFQDTCEVLESDDPITE
jgi:hypothetical protein